MESKLFELGWQYLPQWGWSHWDVRDNDGERILFDSAEAVAKHIGMEQCEECGV